MLPIDLPITARFNLVSDGKFSKVDLINASLLLLSRPFLPSKSLLSLLRAACPDHVVLYNSLTFGNKADNIQDAKAQPVPAANALEKRSEST